VALSWCGFEDEEIRFHQQAILPTFFELSKFFLSDSDIGGSASQIQK
jgi:hypothetical protein